MKRKTTKRTVADAFEMVRTLGLALPDVEINEVGPAGTRQRLRRRPIGLLRVADRLLAAMMFLTTLTFLITTPGWEQSLGGFPALSTVPGQFVLKDVVLLGAALFTAGEALSAVQPGRPDPLSRYA